MLEYDSAADDDSCDVDDIVDADIRNAKKNAVKHLRQLA